jgi:putative tricarboxylic transport membrane protein
MRDRLRALVAGDRLLAVLFIAVLLVYGWDALRMSPTLAADVVGPGFFPKILVVAGFVLAILLLAKPRSEAGKKTNANLELAALAPLGLLIAYALAFEWVGFSLSTAVFLALTFRYLGSPTWRGAIAASVVVTAVIVVVFEFVLDLKLPWGVLFPRLW